MSKYDNNITMLKCPHCKEYLSEDNNLEDILFEMEDEDQEIINCPFCKKDMKISLTIEKEFYFDVLKLTPEEQENQNQTTLAEEDIPGQTTMWEES